MCLSGNATEHEFIHIHPEFSFQRTQIIHQILLSYGWDSAKPERKLLILRSSAICAIAVACFASCHSAANRWNSSSLFMRRTIREKSYHQPGGKETQGDSAQSVSKSCLSAWKKCM
ncbi:MAG TPA: hypothetical protein VFX01_01520, partial [Methylophilaceae bacterium]|nr:hypothetical protein [Methylophilaceae bacterium]